MCTYIHICVHMYIYIYIYIYSWPSNDTPAGAEENEARRWLRRAIEVVG